VPELIVEVWVEEDGSLHRLVSGPLDPVWASALLERLRDEPADDRCVAFVELSAGEESIGIGHGVGNSPPGIRRPRSELTVVAIDLLANIAAS
jgi:hypothetical protein